jgi:hypothetical protein
MNEKQRKILLIGLAVFLLIGLYPPWTETYYSAKYNSEQPKGYSLIFSPPTTYLPQGIKIDVTRLVVQWILAGGVIFVLYYQAGKKS